MLFIMLMQLMTMTIFSTMIIRLAIVYMIVFMSAISIQLLMIYRMVWRVACEIWVTEVNMRK